MSEITLSVLPFNRDNVIWTYYPAKKNDMFIYDDAPIQLLGKGGYGAVYKITGTDIAKLNDARGVVVKFIEYSGESERLEWKNEHDGIETTDEMHEQAFLDDVKYEASIQNDVSSNIKAIDGTPITPRVINAYVMRSKKTGKQYAFIFMEYCDGISFNNILDEKSGVIWANLQYSSVSIYTSIKTQMESILAQLHSKLNIVHGDLLANNVIIQFDQKNTPIVKIIDFGQACPLHLYPYYYAKRVRHRIRPDEATYGGMLELIDKAIELIQHKSFSLGFKRSKKSVRKSKKSVRKSKKSFK